MNLLVYLCQNVLKPGCELALYIRDMLVHYDKKHNQLVFQLNEFERVLLSGNANPTISEDFRDNFFMEEAHISAKLSDQPNTKNRLKPNGLHDIIQKYKPTPKQLEETIREWYIDKIKVQKEAYFQAMRSRDSKTFQSYDDEKFPLFSTSMNSSSRQVPISPTRSPTKKASKRTLDVTAVSYQESLFNSINETSIDKTTSSAFRVANSKSKESLNEPKPKKPYKLNGQSTSMNELNEFLSTQEFKLADPALKPRENKEKVVAPSILNTIFPKKEEPAITDYFRSKVLNDLKKDFKKSKGLEGSLERDNLQYSQEWKFREKFRRAKKLSEYNKTQFLIKKIQSELEKNEPDPFVFDPQNLRRGFADEDVIQNTANIVKDIFNSKNPQLLLAKLDENAPPSPRNLFGFEDKDKNTYSKLEQVMRKNPKIFNITKMIAFKESISPNHPFYKEEQEKLQAMVKKEANKTVTTRKVQAEMVVACLPRT